MKIKIKEIAQKKGWSLYRLAKMMSIPQQTVYSWAVGRTQPSYENMDYLCTVLGCKTGDLFVADCSDLPSLELKRAEREAREAYRRYKTIKEKGGEANAQ